MYTVTAFAVDGHGGIETCVYAVDTLSAALTIWVSWSAHASEFGLPQPIISR